MNNIWGFILSLVNVDQVGLLVMLLVGVILTSIFAAMKAGTLDWSKLKSGWVLSSITFAAYLVTAFMSQLLMALGWSSAWEVLRTGMCVFLTGELTNEILKNLAAMGFPVPAGWAKVWGVRRLSAKLKST
jgi:phage-related holin